MYAGHRSSDGRIQALSDHLHHVAKLCRNFATRFSCGDLAYTIGLCHDLGKYSAAFQKRLLDDGPKVDHSTAGGLEAGVPCGAIGAYCIFGHHGGLPDGGSAGDNADKPTLYGRMKRRIGKELPDCSAFRAEISIPQPTAPQLKPLGNAGFSYAMLIRMLFSCLVDADYLDTEDFMSKGCVHRGGFDGIPVLHGRLMDYLMKFGTPASDINKRRNAILQDCIERAQDPKGLYSLTVPTGGGKTLSSLAFALAHAKKHAMDRVIYVIPYTSIIEQTAGVFAKILGGENVLEHHSGFEYDNEDDDQRRLYLSAENWDAPIIVTTNVQFFESLFAAKTSKCRKNHSVANSVVIFDEAQMLPTPYLLACTRAIAELVHNYGCTAVLCSATQPALDAFLPKEVKRKEICGNPSELYAFFKRVNVQSIGGITDEDLAKRLSDLSQVLCIVNLRKHAQNLFGLMDGEGSFHLSTLMYPEHRKKILETIRTRLKNGEPCRVVATSLVEAGVDVDFPVVFRAKAGLDSIIQAAGRCNREGKNAPDQSITYVFEPDGNYRLPASWQQPAEITGIITRKYPGDFTTPDAIHDYFQALYDLKGEMLDAKGIFSCLENGYKKGGSFPFREIAKGFKLIDEATHAVLIPDTQESADYAASLREGRRDRTLMRRMGRYCVNVYDSHYQALERLGVIECLDSEIAVLTDPSSYCEETGLTLTPEGGKAVFA